MKDFSVKKLIIGCIAITIALLVLLALAFNLYTIESHYSRLESYSECGNNFLDFTSSLPKVWGIEGRNELGLVKNVNWIQIVDGFISHITLALGIVGLSLTIPALFAMEHEKARKVAKTIVILSLIVMFVYMVAGIATSVVIKYSLLELWYDSYNSIIEYSFGTDAFVPFILVLLSAIAFFILDSKLKYTTRTGNEKTADGKATGKAPKQSAVEESEDEKIELIKHYYTLLQDGAITEDEYGAIKAKILGL